MTATTARIDLPGILATAETIGPAPQPWGGETAYCYRVNVRARTASGRFAEFTEKAYGSQHDYARGDDQHTEEMIWLVLYDLLSAYDDPDEFFTLATGDGDDVTADRARGILSVIDYAETIGAALDQSRDEITRGYNGDDE